MTSLDDLIRRHAEQGRLNYLSIAFTNGQWSAACRGVDQGDFHMASGASPVAVLREALTGEAPTLLPRKRRRRPADAAPAVTAFDDILG